MNSAAGSLYVVATPIGNLDDISARALKILQDVALIAAEDTRHSQRLLQHFGISTPLAACHEHNERDEGSRFITRLLAGDNVALISDAGTPLISDPGYRGTPGPRCRHQCRAGTWGVCVDRGAVGGGPAVGPVHIRRFPARQGRGAAGAPGSYKGRTAHTDFYEAPHRILECLQDMELVFGPERQALLARELTKTFETLKGLPLAELRAFVEGDSNQQRGECVVLVAGWTPPQNEEAVSSEAMRILDLLLEEMPSSARPPWRRRLLASARMCCTRSHWKNRRASESWAPGWPWAFSACS